MIAENNLPSVPDSRSDADMNGVTAEEEEIKDPATRKREQEEYAAWLEEGRKRAAAAEAGDWVTARALGVEGMEWVGGGGNGVVVVVCVWE